MNLEDTVSFFVDYNAHKTFCDTTEEKALELVDSGDISYAEFIGIVDKDSLWTARVYPDTHVGFVEFYSDDYALVMDKVERYLNERD